MRYGLQICRVAMRFTPLRVPSLASCFTFPSSQPHSLVSAGTNPSFASIAKATSYPQLPAISLCQRSRPWVTRIMSLLISSAAGVGG